MEQLPSKYLLWPLVQPDANIKILVLIVFRALNGAEFQLSL